MLIMLRQLAKNKFLECVVYAAHSFCMGEIGLCEDRKLSRPLLMFVVQQIENKYMYS